MAKQFIGRAIGHETYRNFARKYKIPLKDSEGKLKPYKQLAQEIYRHELKHTQIKRGLYIGGKGY